MENCTCLEIGTLDDLLLDVAKTESTWGKDVGVRGNIFQMDATALAAAGYTGTVEKFNKQGAEVQADTILAYWREIRNQLGINGALTYVGETKQGRVITESGLIVAAHLVGASKVKDWMKTGNNHNAIFNVQ